MKKLFMSASLVMLVGSFEMAHGGNLRIDLKDRSPEDVVKKAKNLGAVMKEAKAVGAIVIDGEELATGIALDPWTILTAAHQFCGKKDPKIALVFNENCREKPTNFVSHEPILHPSFSKKTNPSSQKISVNTEEKQIYVSGIPLDKVGTLSFEELQESVKSTLAFMGTDLAILKLEKPLPSSTPFPELMAEEKSYSDTYGISIGYGSIKYNDQEVGPTLAIKDPFHSNTRHVISCNVSNKNLFDNSVFAGSYKGKLINGDESFIPNDKMLKTEGIQTAGDSGSPLFITNGEQYKLTGIFSRNLAAWRDNLKDLELREALSQYNQPIHPIWTDLRPYLPWIKKHMGEGNVN